MIKLEDNVCDGIQKKQFISFGLIMKINEERLIVLNFKPRRKEKEEDPEEPEWRVSTRRLKNGVQTRISAWRKPNGEKPWSSEGDDGCHEPRLYIYTYIYVQHFDSKQMNIINYFGISFHRITLQYVQCIKISKYKMDKLGVFFVLCTPLIAKSA